MRDKIINKLRGVQLLTAEYSKALGTIIHIVEVKLTWRQRFKVLFGGIIKIESEIECENIRVIVKAVDCEITII